MLSKIQFFNFLSILFISIGMSACGGGNVQGTGTLEIGITDAPVDSAAEDDMLTFSQLVNVSVIAGVTSNGDINL